jgi:flagellar motor switch protein FliM
VSKVLSQDEVNALLKDVKLQDEPQDEAIKAERKNINIYDFKHPDRISKDQLRAFKTIHSNFSKVFGTFLSTKLRTTVDLNVLSVDQLTYSEFTMTMASPSCIYIVLSEMGNGNFVIEFAPELVFFIIDRLLGGRGDILEESREITIIEENVLKKIAERAIIQLDEAWEQAVSLKPKIVKFETNPQFVQIARASEPSIVISFSVKISNFNSIISLCFPCFVLEPVMSQLNIQSWASTKHKEMTKQQVSLLEDKLRSTLIDISARITTQKIKLNDIVNLEMGDVLVFDKRIDKNFQILLSDKPKFWGKPGILGRNLAVKITDTIVKEELHDDE